MDTKKMLRLLLVLVLVLSMAVGCSVPGAKTEKPVTESAPVESKQETVAEPVASQNEPHVIRFAIAAEPPTMDPQIKTATSMSSTATHIYEGLVRVFNGEIKPGMADSWKVSEDGLTYTFHIRDDAKWGDGEKLVADSFLYAFERILDPAVASEFAYLAYDIVNAEAFNTGAITDFAEVGVKAPDDSTLVISLKTPVSYWLSFMDFTLFSPARRDFVEAAGMGYGADAENCLCNGPYVLTEWVHDSHLVMAKNEYYWDKDSITTDQIEAYVVLDGNTGISMYENGELDIVDIPKDLIPTYEEQGMARVYSDGGEYFMMANYKGMTAETGKLLGNKNFMKAIGYGIDRELFIKAVLGDATKPATRFNLPLLNILLSDGTQTNFNDKFPLEAYPANADLAKANEYLELALQETGFTKETLPTFSYVTRDADYHKLMAEALQDMLVKNLGITIDITIVPYKQWLELVNQHEYDLCLYGWGPDYDDPMTYMDLWLAKESTPGGNMANYDNPEYNEKILFAKSTTDMDARAQTLYEAEQLLLDGGPIIPMYVRYYAYVQREGIDNIDRPFIGGQPKCMYATFE